jgi:alanine dehydrogenase
MAIGMGAHVTIIDRSLNRLRELDDIFNGYCVTLASNAWTISENLKTADLVVGAVLIPGASAPRLVKREMISKMKRGAVVVDVAMTRAAASRRRTPPRARTHLFRRWRLHYCVSNMPAAVPPPHAGPDQRDIPLPSGLANYGLEGACERHAALREGVNTYNGITPTRV